MRRRKNSSAEAEKRKKIQQPESEGGGGLILKLPIEIFAKILSTRSLKTICGYRLVSKTWFHTINSPSFLEAYNPNLIHLGVLSKRSTHSVYCLPLQPQASSPTTYTPNLPLVKPIVDIFSCNGLLLLVSFLKRYRYYICNPITGDCTTVPTPPSRSHHACSYNSFGFGYDPVSKLCKFVNISEGYTEQGLGGTKVEIYNVATGKWRVVEGGSLKLLAKPLFPNASVNGKQVWSESFERVSYHAFVNGALHWIGFTRITGARTIIAFKLDTEEFYQVPMPPRFGTKSIDGVSKRIPFYLFVVKECLSLVDCVGLEHAEIWVMKNAYWEKEYIIKDIVMDRGSLIKGSYMPIKFMPNGEILLEYDSPKRLGYYHPATKAFRYFGSIESDYDWGPMLHVGSLISPGSIAI